jgi:predicted dehydrogenase
MSLKPVKVGVIGCGAISNAYFKANKTFEILDFVACADLMMDRAKAKAEEHGIPTACTVEELLANDEIELVINLTVPKVHAEVNEAIINAGKSPYVEKPFAVSREDGQKIIKLAKDKGVLTGGAPDTFFGGGHQTCRKLIDDGWIGKPVAATAFMMSGGVEGWHPNPWFYYDVGGGPMFDMGPYYLTAFVNMFGPARRITGSTSKGFEQRVISNGIEDGKVIDVVVPTHVAGLVDYHNGATLSIVTSFDIKGGANLPNIEVYGTEGSIVVPDPNGFGGKVIVRRHDSDEALEVPHTHGYNDDNRGIGAADMAYALRTGRKHRANGDLTFHVLDQMHCFHDACDTGKHVEVASTCDQPAMLPLGLRPGTLEE